MGEAVQSLARDKKEDLFAGYLSHQKLNEKAFGLDQKESHKNRKGCQILNCMSKKNNKKVRFPMHVLQPVREYLLRRETELRKRKKSLAKEDPFADTERLNDNAAVDLDAAEEVGHERIRILKLEIDKTLIRVRKALTRIKVGKYGVCSKCGEMIDTDRLAIDPTASLCVTCANNKEKK